MSEQKWNQEIYKDSLVIQMYKFILNLAMEGNFENLHADLNSLNPIVKIKAIQIAKNLMTDENLPEKKAIPLAIKKAEEWFMTGRVKFF